MNGSLPPAVFDLFVWPLAALAVGFFVFHRRRPRLTHWPILASCVAVTAASWSLLWQVSGGAVWDRTLFSWMGAGGFQVDFGVRIDGLSAPVLAMATLVGTLIHAYAVGCMKDDPGFSRFFLYFHLLLFSMIGLVASNNYAQAYLFWEGVGLCSFLLIGFRHDRASARAAAWKAFLTNRIGDAGFLLAVFLLLAHAGTGRYSELFERLPGLEPRFIGAAALLLFWAACAKSAQFPLHVWLPDAVEGPAPALALMHAATTATAGVFLLARSWPLLEASPRARLLMAAAGLVTALGAAVIASMRKDLRRNLAYSTVSHLDSLAALAGRAAGWLAREWEARRWDPWTESLADTALGLGEGLSGLARGRLNDALWWLLVGASVLGASACF